MKDQKIEPIGYILLSALTLAITYGGFLAYKSIDWGVLQRLESQTLILPTQAPVDPSKNIPELVPATSSAVLNQSSPSASPAP